MESGHGKGPCDGLGASVKRAADMAVRQGKASIQDGKDFNAWSVQAAESGSKVKYVFYSQTDIDESKSILDSKTQCQPVSGTFKLHAVVPLDHTKIATRNTSCYCEKCVASVLEGCGGWEIKHIVKQQTSENREEVATVSNNYEEVATGSNNDEEVATGSNNDEEVATANNDTEKPKMNAFVAAIYDNEWYIGQITKVNNDDQEAQINFMTKSGKFGNSYKWPAHNDEIWIPFNDILMEIGEPEVVGKTGRCFRFKQAVIDAVEEKSIPLEKNL